MMFPQIPRDIDAELFLGGQWVDVTSDVYARDGITITRGARDETSRTEPSRCQLTLNNRTGNYSPRNPTGAYFGDLGRNTPLRVSVGKDVDTFTRTVSSGWGSTDGGNSWSTYSAGGTISASDYNVSAGVGTVSIPIANAIRLTYLAGQSYEDVDIAVTASLSLASVTGGGVAPANLLLRGTDTSNYILVFLYVDVATGRYFLAIYDYIAGGFTNISDGNIDTGITYAASQQVRVRAQAEGPVVRAKVWRVSTGEPYEWTAGGGSDITTSGWVGIRSEVVTGNTNTKPVVYTYDNVVVRVPRYAGEVSYWPQRWDTSGQDFYVPIEASGIKRRLGQGIAPVNSAMLTSVTSLATPPVAYWPCEDGSSVASLSATIGSSPMVIRGSTKPADFSGFACSQPIPTLDVGTWQGRVAPYTGTGSVQLRYLIHVSTSEPPDDWPISQIFTTGSAPQYEVKYRTGGLLEIQVWSPGGLIIATGSLAFFQGGRTLIDSLWMLSLTMQQSGPDVNVQLDALKVGDTISSGWATTVTSRTVGVATSVVIDPYQKMRGVSVGHITVRTQPAISGPIFDTSYGLNAYSGPPEIGGETALDRIIRLTTAASVPIDWQGFRVDAPMMGAQRPVPLLNLLEESADVDMGVLHETRGRLGLAYRTRKSMYNQPGSFVLDYADGQVAPPLEPVDDDQQTRNDVIAKRTDGSSFELFLSAGRLAITDPWTGGVGLYTDAPTLNVGFDDQLPDIAGWRLLLGTVDEARYPTIKVNLANGDVVAAGLDNAVMSADIGDRIIIANPPARITPNPIAQIIRGYTETLNVFEHFISFICAPASPYDVIRAGGTGQMAVDSDASSLASGVTTTATSLSVATTAGGALWGTGSVTFDITIEGERITVTNISGTSSPQTFTAVRSVNGIVKTHGSGATVRLFRPALIGL